MGFVFESNRYGDTILEIGKQRMKLYRLFGLKMETEADLAGRLTGTFDIFSSLGCAGEEITKENISQIDTEVSMTAELYGGKLRYHTGWEYDKELGILKRKDTLKNVWEQPVTIYKAQMRFLFAYDEWEAYTQNTRWCHENIGKWNQVPFGGVSLACEGGRTTQGAVPLLALRNKKNRGVVFHLAPVGNWEINFKTVSLGVSQPGEYGYLLEMGQSRNHFAYELGPGGTYEFPVVYIQALTEKGLTESAAALQKYFLSYDLGRNRISHPLVYNPWFEHYALLDEKRLKQHVEAARELGCEVFEIDAGWYGSKEGDWWSQSGDWQERTEGGFYGRMREFADFVRSRGMGFGLWMEPERIGAGTPVYEKHPEYFGHGNGFYYPKLYLPQVEEYLYEEITGLIEKYDLCWMKMDFNYELGEDETWSEFYLYYRAWYRLLNRIKAGYPNTYLEACAAGGQRNDLNTSLIYDGHFLSDNVNAWDMLFTYQQCCLRMPHYRMIKWMVANPGARISPYESDRIEKIDTMVTPQRPGAGWDEYERISPEFLCQMTMTGLVGLSGNYIDITEEQKETIKSYIGFYKKYRGFFKESVLYMGEEPNNVGDRDGFAHLQYAGRNEDVHLVYCFRFITASPYDTFYAKELEEQKIYKVTDAVTEELIGEYTGEELMHRGLSLEYQGRHSGKIFVIR